MNNLLERLHASFFFYILTSAQSFVKVGGYLPAAVIMSIAMTFGGLALWVQAGWLQTHVVVVEPSEDLKAELVNAEKAAETPQRWIRRSRPVVDALLLMGYAHVLGAGFLFALGTKSAVELFTVSLYPTVFIPLLSSSTCLQVYPTEFLIALSAITALVPCLLACMPRLNPPPQRTAPLYLVLKSFNLCLGGTITALLSLLNFSLAAVLVILLGAPLSYLPPTKSSRPRAATAFFLLQILTPFTLVLGAGWFVDQAEVIRVGRMVIWEWKVLGVWTLPFAMVVYLPLVWQAQVASILVLL
jgi:glycosylphosphatidylinositol transamidase